MTGKDSRYKKSIRNRGWSRGCIAIVKKIMKENRSMYILVMLREEMLQWELF